MALLSKSHDSDYIFGRFNELKFSWVVYYAWLRIVVNPSEWLRKELNTEVKSDGTQLYLIRLGDRPFASDFIILIANLTEKIARTYFGQVHFANKVTYCEAMIHSLSSEERMFDICKNVGGHWVCDDCVDRFTLAETIYVSAGRAKTREETEREKLNPALRYQILLRDGFACRGCGRSPLNGDKVKLHVDHIMPISRGGKTVPANLCTLCQDCNLGKSNIVVGEEVQQRFRPKPGLGKGDLA